jgi:hypothetical protein
MVTFWDCVKFAVAGWLKRNDEVTLEDLEHVAPLLHFICPAVDVLTHVKPGITPSLKPEQPEPVQVKETEKVPSSPQLRYEPWTEVIFAGLLGGGARGPSSAL